MAKNTTQAVKTEITITTSSFLRIVLLVIGTVTALAALRQMTHALVILFTAFFLALALNAPVAFFARHLPGKIRGSRAWGTSIAFLLVIGLLGAFIASLVPPLVQQAQSLADAAPSLIDDVRNQNGAVGEIIRKYNLQDQVTSFSEQLSTRLRSGAGQAFSTFQSFGSSVFTVLTVLVLTFMMLVEGPQWVRFFHELVPQRRKKMAKDLMNDMYRVVKGFVNGQVTLAALAAVVITPVFFVMDVSYPIGLTFIVFVAGLIPMVGHTIGAVVVSLVALFTSPTAALVVLTYYLVYQQFENILIQPKIQANSTDMSPLLVFGSVIVGVSFSGLLGGLVAIPVAGCIRVAFLEYLKGRQFDNAPIVDKEINSVTIDKTR